jgi:thioredoxin 1
MKNLVLIFLLLGAVILRAADASAPAAKAVLPRLVDLGADKCIPCKLMTPILAELAKEHAGQLDVVFIDVWKNREEGERYGIRVIPTQIFYGADGKELFRHEGFYAKKDILAKWAELGVGLKPQASPEEAPQGR